MDPRDEELARLRRRVSELENENARLTQQLAHARSMASANLFLPRGSGPVKALPVSAPSPNKSGRPMSSPAKGRTASITDAGFVPAPAPAPLAASVSAPVASAAAAEPVPAGHELCDNCGRPIPAATLAMHKLHCARNNTRCGMCGKVVAARELEGHIKGERGSAAAMVAAVAAGDGKSIASMLLHGGSIQEVCLDGTGDLPLHVAARHRRLDMLELLLSKGASINAVNSGGESALHIACSLKDELQSSSASKESDSKASEGGGASVAAASAGSSSSSGEQANPAARAAELVSFLIARGCDVDARTVLGDTPVQVAQRCGNPEVLLLLSTSGGALRPVSRDARRRPLSAGPLRRLGFDDASLAAATAASSS